jgi:transposase-like protein
MRSELALTLAMAEMYVQGVSTRKVVSGLLSSNTVTTTGLSPVSSR